jgi:predicted TIM-barrel fold metal-dependent hydrolase
VIDCDVHCEVPDLAALVPFLPRHWRERLRENQWAGPAGVHHCDPPAVAGEAMSDVGTLRERLFAAQTETDAAILTCYYAVESLRHPDLTADLAAATNRWLRAEWLEREPRLRGSLVVPTIYPEAAAAEIRRWKRADGFVQVLLPVAAQRTFGSRFYWPLYEAAQDQGFVIGLHFGGVSGGPPTASGWPTYYVEEVADMASIFQGHLLSLIAEGVVRQFPGLRFTLLESGVTWLPTLLWRLDKMWKSYRREIPWIDRLPSEYLRANIRLTTQPLDGPDDPTKTAAFLSEMNIQQLLLYSSDAPHVHGSSSLKILELLSPKAQESVFATNARAWYGLHEAA